MSEKRNPSNLGAAKDRPLDLESFKSEERFRLMVDAVLDYSMFMLDPQGFVATWNLGAQRLKGYAVDEIIGQHFSVFYPAHVIDSRLPEHELEVATAQGRFQGQGWRLRKDGSSFWANVVITALRDSDGTLLGFGNVTQDLTERQLADLAIRQSNDRTTALTLELSNSNSYLKNVLASTLVSIIATDPKGIITTFNRGAELLLGYTATEIIGKHTPALFHLADEIETRGLALSKRVGRALHGFDVFTASIGVAGCNPSEWTYVHKDGHHILVNLSLSAVQGDNGQTIGFLGVAEDVTERHRAARELATAYAQVRSVLECTSDSVITLSHDWIILYGNRKAQESLPDFKVGKIYWNCFPGLMGTPAEQHLRNAMEKRTETTYETFYTLYEQWYRGHAFPSDDGLTIFFSNITEDKNMRDQLELEQLLREKRIEALSHMAGGLAHEISHPLAIIHAKASDLKRLAEEEAQIPSTDIRGICESIVQTSDRAIKILRGLRGFARESSKDPVEMVSIDAIIDECVEMQQTRFDRHNVEVRLTYNPGIPRLLCRPVQVGQILSNLLNNAFDAIVQTNSLGRWIHLTARCTGADICVDVADSGPGIEDHFKDHLMEPFFTTKEFGLGMGVGLSLSRAIAEDHGGSLSLLKDTPHTCFRLVLPLVPYPVGKGLKQS
jgi:PAS domain S-box-containing protein